MILVAIDGAGGSGKSTLARELQAADNQVSIVQIDDFYRPLDEAKRITLNAQEGYEQYFDWQRLCKQVLNPLSLGRSTQYQCYNWETGSLGDWVEIKPEGIKLVEGIYTFRPELQKYYDFSIFVATPQSERLKRMISRQQNSSEWIHRWMAAEDWYLNTVNPKDVVNLILSGDKS